MNAEVRDDIALEYDGFGNPSDPPLLLVMGLGFQLIHWDPEFCQGLADRGFHVIRFDNRDVGLSTKIRGAPKPNLLAAAAGASGSRPTVVLHGTTDPLVPPRAGRATAAAIPGAHLVELEGMGHDLPRQKWQQMTDAIVQNTERAARPQGVR